MRRIFTMFIVLMLTAATVLMANGRNGRELRVPGQQKVISKRMIQPKAEGFFRTTPPENPVPSGPRDFVPTLDRTTTFNYYHMQVDSSRNGYGWLDASIRTMARYNDVDTWGSSSVEDYLLLGYRQFLASDENTGIIGTIQIDLSSGLENSNPAIFENINGDLNSSYAGSGGRYPSVCVTDYPIVVWNQYMNTASTLADPPESHPYNSANIDGYNAQGTWELPVQLDDGYTDPNNGSAAPDVNRLWQQSTTAAQPNVSTENYYLISVMDTWMSDGEKSFYHEDHCKNLMNGNTDDPSFEWTEAWHPSDPQVDNWTMLNNAVDMNKSGLAAVVGAGELEYHPSDSGWYYEEMKITYMTSNDYGATWSSVDTVHFADFFPLYVYAEDSLILYWQVIGPDTVLTSYEGPTFSGMESDIDVIVGENDTIYVGFQKLWGRPSEDGSGWYPNGNYTGFYVAMSGDHGATWSMSPIAANVGFYQDDDDPPNSEMTMTFFGPEIDLGMDESGNLYAGWLDRPRHNPQQAPAGRYVSINDGGSKDYVTDVYVSRSTNNGGDWSWPLNATETPSIDEYEFKMAKQASSADNGTVYFGYNIAATDRLLASGENSGTMPDLNRDAYVDMVNYVWVGYGNDLRDVSGVSDEVVHTAKSFALEQNYPNPFNPETQIEFTAAKSTHALVDVYSLTGEKVATVFDGQARSGLNKVRFNGSNLAAGVYFYRLTMAGKSAVRKMVLVK